MRVGERKEQRKTGKKKIWWEGGREGGSGGGRWKDARVGRRKREGYRIQTGLDNGCLKLYYYFRLFYRQEQF